jgi:vanillate O-demethylase ferredoxin subunit
MVSLSVRGEKREVRVKSITEEARGIHSFDLRPLDGSCLPSFKAGAHIDVHLSGGIVRSYSLANPETERNRYLIGVQNGPASRGGSRQLHETVRAGQILTITPPRNHFPLIEDAPHTFLIAGGIGITPLWCMIQRLEHLGRSWELHYCAREREVAAFYEPLHELKKSGASVLFNFDSETGGKTLDLAAEVRRVRADAHLYCCGPTSMLAAFEDACVDRAPSHVHVEYFSGKPRELPAGGFTIKLARSGREILVAEGKTILDALREEGVSTDSSCLEGVCGSCETTVLEGIPDHRDLILTQAERMSNRTMMICCSGSKTSRLTLDL